jgi:acetyl-CoA C-acetyltransferase
MNSNQFVDQAAALVVCSVAVARSAGIARDRWVFPWAAASAHAPFVSERRLLHEAPTLRRAARSVERATGRPAADADLIDLYACFPSAVQIQAEALGVADRRPLTLTGGMRFAGGPWNSYGLHQLANVVGGLRGAPEAHAFCSTNGGFASRFVVGAYSGEPPPRGFQRLARPFAPGAEERIPLDEDPHGEATIEGFTVVHDRGNAPVEGIAACLTPAGARAWAVLRDPADLDGLLATREAGRRVRFGARGAHLA